jgi:hypothetical protein
VSRIVAVILVLLAAVHVGIPALAMPAPVPVLLAFVGVIGTLLWLIWEAAFRSQMHWRAGP